MMLEKAVNLNAPRSLASGWILALGLVLALGACSSSSGNKTAAGQQAVRGGYKIGVPYTIRGVKYYPKEDFAYDRTGLASWYGDPFHGRKTASGEIYNKWAMTAAHKTLQMPSLVEVTNLENGRKLILRINDRGPFVSGRIIDLSRGAARKLGVEKTGVAKVRVRILKKESLRLKELALANKKPSAIAAAPRSNVVAQTLPPTTGRSLSSPSGAPTALTAPSLANQTGVRPTTAKPVQVSVRQPVGAGRSVVVPAAKIISPPAANGGSIFIQAGAFRSAGNARRLRESLAEIGRARVVSVDVDGQRYYRVRLGPVATVEQGNRLLARIVSAGYPRARMIRQN